MVFNNDGINRCAFQNVTIKVYRCKRKDNCSAAINRPMFEASSTFRVRSNKASDVLFTRFLSRLHHSLRQGTFQRKGSGLLAKGKQISKLANIKDSLFHRTFARAVMTVLQYSKFPDNFLFFHCQIVSVKQELRASTRLTNVFKGVAFFAKFAPWATYRIDRFPSRVNGSNYANQSFFSLTKVLLRENFMFSLGFHVLLFGTFVFLTRLFMLFRDGNGGQFFRYASAFCCITGLSGWGYATCEVKGCFSAIFQCFLAMDDSFEQFRRV